ncbi:aldehyde dehydrogenase family protein [Pseudofrankia asymbiotica]|uniref:Aldehyde dehydrogenase n=1 Tax=Pseudofrankia asymbiotica TaxID=1834516 RepID=A0A1V2I7L7_9ACTN|nr:aldehyde dehydrogenase family protein [Pseudofrankia asymbiotica]ONH28035.1 aldehyde dehydrogenase [Pseudofrankia asymbiotica]
MDVEPRLLVDGKLVPAATGRTYDNINPYTEAVLGSAPDAGPDDTDAALAAARRAFDATDWSRDHAFRAHCLRQLQTVFRANAERLREVLLDEVGCPVFMTRQLQLDATIDEIEYWAGLAENYPFETSMPPVTSPGGTNNRTVLREAVGVVAAIVAYNYPFQQIMLKLGPALAAGNTVVLKPSPLTPWTANLVAALATETDLPPGVLNILTSAGDEVGRTITSDPRVDLVAFTGSTAVGRAIMAAAAPTVKNLVLELGGKSANVVLDDADIEATVRANVVRVSRHSGQGCSNLTRLLLPRSRYEEGLEIAAATALQIPWGDPRDERTHMGPLISAAQRASVLARVERGLAEGGRLVAGGHAIGDHGYFVEPTVIADVDPDASLAQEEVFGPVLAVIPYDTDDEAVAIANNSVFGLAGAVASADQDRAVRIARRLRTALVDVNGATYYSVDTPRGGIRQSGVSDEYGVPGLEAYLETRIISTPATPGA